MFDIKEISYADFLSGALDKDEKDFKDQLKNIKELEQKLINNYNENMGQFLNTTGITKDDLGSVQQFGLTNGGL